MSHSGNASEVRTGFGNSASHSRKQRKTTFTHDPLHGSLLFPLLPQRENHRENDRDRYENDPQSVDHRRVCLARLSRNLRGQRARSTDREHRRVVILEGHQEGQRSATENGGQKEGEGHTTEQEER